MRSKRLPKTWLICMQIFFIFVMQWTTEGAVMAPPWANPKLNPCAAKPRGWQLLYWPPDGKCYKIFQVGYPCPEGMELSPVASNSEEQLSAECRCPPKTAQSAANGKCYELFSLGPCTRGSYFGPDTQMKFSNTSKRQWGMCKQIMQCPDSNWIFWPKDGQCYQKLTRGPCQKGQLLTVNTLDGLPICKCNKQRELRDFRHEDGRCYQHFTRGPCLEKGFLFLPDRTCGCHSFLPHYHNTTEQCFELGTRGPCSRGELYQLHPETRTGICHCKPGYIRYYDSTACYRPYTQGPCKLNHFLLNSTSCMDQPCPRGYLYFPIDNKCHRIGTRGPCSKGHVVTFDFETRPSIDGISYNGVCICDKRKCEISDDEEPCDKTKGMVRYKNQCHKLYSQGPCPKGAWLAPKRQGREELFSDDGPSEMEGVCECIPSYARTSRSVGGKNVTVCVSPTVMLANYLNKNFTAVAHVIKL